MRSRTKRDDGFPRILTRHISMWRVVFFALTGLRGEIATPRAAARIRQQNVLGLDDLVDTLAEKSPASPGFTPSHANRQKLPADDKSVRAQAPA